MAEGISFAIRARKTWEINFFQKTIVHSTVDILLYPAHYKSQNRKLWPKLTYSGWGQGPTVFRDEIMNRPPLINATTTTINDKYSIFVEYVNDANAKIFGYDNSRMKQKEGITNEIMKIVGKQAKAFLD